MNEPTTDKPAHTPEPKRLQYELRISKSEIRSVHFDAADPETAINEAREGNPGWIVSGAVQLDRETGDPVEEHEIQAECENCDRIIFDHKYTHTEDGDFCPECFAALSSLGVTRRDER